MIKIIEIKKLVSKGETKEALDHFQLLLGDANSQILKQVLILSSEFNQWKKKNRLGLQPNEAVLRRIDLAILELCEDLEKPKSTQTQKLINHLNLERHQLDVIIQVHENAIKRATIFASILVLFGIMILVTTHYSKIIEGEMVKLILTIASILISSISGFSIKDINEKYGSLKIFRHFKMYILNLINDGTLPNLENRDEINKIKDLIWEATRKTALNS